MSGLGQDQYLVFAVGTQQCATPVTEVREILMMASLSSAPGLSPYQAGFLNLGGEAIPVLSMTRILGLPDQENGLYSHILLSRGESRSVGFLTQTVQKIMTHPREELLPTHAELSFRDFALGMLPDGQDFLTVLSLPRLLAAFEARSLISTAPFADGALSLQKAKKEAS